MLFMTGLGSIEGVVSDIVEVHTFMTEHLVYRVEYVGSLAAQVFSPIFTMAFSCVVAVGMSVHDHRGVESYWVLGVHDNQKVSSGRSCSPILHA